MRVIAPKVRILSQTLCSHSLTDRMIGYGLVDLGSNSGGSVIYMRIFAIRDEAADKQKERKGLIVVDIL